MVELPRNPAYPGNREWVEVKGKQKTTHATAADGSGRTRKPRYTDGERRFVIIRRDNSGTAPRSATAVLTAITQALTREGAPSAVRVEWISISQRFNYTGMVTMACTGEEIEKYKPCMMNAIKAIDPGIEGLQQSGTWRKLKLHGIQVDAYRREGGLDDLVNDIDAENHFHRMTPIRWLMRVEILRDEASQGLKEGSTVVLTVHNHEVAARLI